MLKQNDEGVSPVIGVILMVAITVVLAAVVWVMVSKLAQDSPAELTTLGIQRKESPLSYMVMSAPNDLTYQELTISGCATHKTTGVVLAGDSFTGCTSPLLIVYENQVIYQDTE